jgi:erythromycin esterase-like protein
MHYRNALEAVRSAAIPLTSGAADSASSKDYDALLALAGERSFVLLGEATHGTHEFYRMRVDITQRLIREHNFDAVAVEADWPDAYRLNRFVRGQGDATPGEAFADFRRFPTWMWRNRDVLDFIVWLRVHNMQHVSRDAATQVGFYGLDLYSLYRSVDAVTAYLEQVDPEQAKVARHLYAALDHVRNPQEYGYEAAAGLRPSCRDAAAVLLTDLVKNASEYLAAGGLTAPDEHFFAERNAYVVLNAEQYYRAMFTGRVNTWNLRDAHMVNTLQALRQHLRSNGREGKIVVWAHNSHLGDARATEMGERGEWNVGQLLRQRVGAHETLLVGFTTYTGHVTAAREWDGEAEHRWVRPAHANSIEHLFYSSRRDRFFLAFGNAEDDAVARALDEPLLERAIGVLYRPETELASHYFRARLAWQFDAVFHLDETSAVEPLDTTDLWHARERVEDGASAPSN